MKIDGNTLTAEEDRALCRKGESGPTKVTRIVLSSSDAPENWQDCEYGEPPTTARYSVRKIIAGLKSCGKFAAVRALLEAQKETEGYDWLFVGSNYLASDDEDFRAMCAAIVENGVMPQAELEEMLARCFWEQT